MTIIANMSQRNPFRQWKLALWAALIPIAALSLAGRGVAHENRSAFSETLRQPGVHAIMRHALAPGTGDPPLFALDDCVTQRNLNERGRAQARAVGEMLRNADINFDQVRSSQWCRCIDTATLLDLGPVVEDPYLNSFFEDRSTASAQTSAMRDYLRALPTTRRVMLVTHQVNITALTGEFVSSGEIFLITVSEKGDVTVLDRLEVRP